VALDAARAAGRIHLRRLSRIKVTRKTNLINLVTEADRESEQAVIRTLDGAFPDHAILAEKSGANARRSEHRWIVDPLDGTTNFAHGFPQFCVSIAYERRGRLERAVVYDALKRELFVAARGRGMMRTQGVRHPGSAVLNLCYVACGRVDALWEFGLRPWDVAAGALIVPRRTAE